MKRSSSTRVWIPIGAALFFVALTISALVVPQLRLLHLLQAFICVAVVIFARRNSVWAPGAGVTIGIVCNSVNLLLLNQTTDNKKWWKFVAGGALTLAYFALIVAVARPH